MRFIEVVFLLLAALAVIGLCLHGWLVEGHSPTVILPPTGIAGVLVLLSAIRVWRTLRVGEKGANAILQHRYWDELRASFPGLLWCLAALPTIALLGYPIGLALFAVVFGRAHGGSWLGSLLSGGFVFAVCWFLAARVLSISIDLLPGWLA